MQSGEIIKMNSVWNPNFDILGKTVAYKLVVIDAQMEKLNALDYCTSICENTQWYIILLNLCTQVYFVAWLYMPYVCGYRDFT